MWQVKNGIVWPKKPSTLLPILHEPWLSGPCYHQWLPSTKQDTSHRLGSVVSLVAKGLERFQKECSSCAVTVEVVCQNGSQKLVRRSKIFGKFGHNLCLSKRDFVRSRESSGCLVTTNECSWIWEIRQSKELTWTSQSYWNLCCDQRKSQEYHQKGMRQQFHFLYINTKGLYVIWRCVTKCWEGRWTTMESPIKFSGIFFFILVQDGFSMNPLSNFIGHYLVNIMKKVDSWQVHWWRSYLRGIATPWNKVWMRKNRLPFLQQCSLPWIVQWVILQLTQLTFQRTNATKLCNQFSL